MEEREIRRGARSTNRPRTATWIAEFSATERSTAGALTCATYSWHSAVLSARDHPPGCEPERPCTSSTVEGAPTEKEGLWPFGPTNEPLASLGHSVAGNVSTDTNERFGAFGGVRARELAARHFWSRRGQSGDWGSNTALPVLCRP